MTSASELFIARRAARGARLSDPDPDPDPQPVALRDQHGLGGRRQRRGCRPRRQLDAAGDVRQHLHTGAPPPRRRGSYTVRIRRPSLPPASLLSYQLCCGWIGESPALAYTIRGHF
jgi:hypothetical protein